MLPSRFLVQLKDDTYVIVEVKGDNMIEDEVVRAKSDYAYQIAVASKMTYDIIKGSDAMQGRMLFQIKPIMLHLAWYYVTVEGGVFLIPF
jgi:hypothetical protein